MSNKDNNRIFFLLEKEFQGPGLTDEEEKELLYLNTKCEQLLDPIVPAENLLTEAERNYLNEIISRAKR